MVLTQWYQMRLNPMQLGPEMSEAQRINAKMMRFMPFMFLVFLYFFSSALVLYWTVQNIMTILQTLLTKNTVEIPKALETDNEANSSTADNKKKTAQYSEHEGNDLDEVQVKSRNLLGLKIKTDIDSKLLESRYKERMENYTQGRLDGMTEQKRKAAEKKRDKIMQAYEALKKELES